MKYTQKNLLTLTKLTLKQLEDINEEGLNLTFKNCVEITDAYNVRKDGDIVYRSKSQWIDRGVLIALNKALKEA